MKRRERCLERLEAFEDISPRHMQELALDYADFDRFLANARNCH
jgi:hypothetical protein